MKVAAVIILFHPDIQVINNIKTYYELVEKIFVFDNTENNSVVKDELKLLPKIEFFQNYENKGIAKTLNTSAEKALANGFKWLLTMDQDSFFKEESIISYFNCINNYSTRDKVAMFGTRYGQLKDQSLDKCTPVEIHELITSGTLLNLEVYKKIGNFDEALFIDSVDHDFCIRAKLAGFNLVQFSNIYLFHHLGTQIHRSSIKTLFLLKKTKRIHSPLRCYYMYRNLLYLEKKYAGVKPGLLLSIRNTAISNIRSSIFYGRNTFKILRYLMAARKDFKKNKMGKIEE